MSRAAIRTLKQALRRGAHGQASPAQAQEARAAALALLRRSVALKHDRLAIQRLLDAVRLGATVDEPLWAHCEAAAASVGDATQRLALRALRQHTTGHFRTEPLLKRTDAVRIP